MALKMYAEDYDTHLPPARSWSDALPEHVLIPGAFRCAEDAQAVSYAFDQSLDQMRIDRITSAGMLPMLYDSKIGAWNATDHGESFARRHERNGRGGWGIVAFVDGHVQAVRAFPPTSLNPPKGSP